MTRAQYTNTHQKDGENDKNTMWRHSTQTRVCNTGKFRAAQKCGAANKAVNKQLWRHFQSCKQTVLETKLKALRHCVITLRSAALRSGRLLP